MYSKKDETLFNIYKSKVRFRTIGSIFYIVRLLMASLDFFDFIKSSTFLVSRQ